MQIRFKEDREDGNGEDKAREDGGREDKGPMADVVSINLIFRDGFGRLESCIAGRNRLCRK